MKCAECKAVLSGEPTCPSCGTLYTVSRAGVSIPAMVEEIEQRLLRVRGRGDDPGVDLVAAGQRDAGDLAGGHPDALHPGTGLHGHAMLRAGPEHRPHHRRRAAGNRSRSTFPASDRAASMKRLKIVKSVLPPRP